MMRWGRWGGALLTAGLLAAASGCGQLFAQGQQPVTLTQLANRVDSIDAQVGEMQAALANMGSSGTAGAAGATTTPSEGVVQSGLPVAVVQADVLNVRSEPSLSGTIVGTLLQNSEVNVITNDGNWSEISFTNPNTQVHLTGWVDADYLGPATSAPPTGTTVAGSSTGSGTATGSASGSSGAAASPVSGTSTAASGSAAVSGSGVSGSTAY